MSAPKSGTGAWWALVLEAAANGVARSQDICDDGDAMVVEETFRSLAADAASRPKTQHVVDVHLVRQAPPSRRTRRSSP